MKKFITIFALCLGSQAMAQFKSEVVINGITYKAKVNDGKHATFIQQDNFDFSLAADSFYVDVMTEEQWDKASDALVKEEKAFFQDGMYHTPQGCQVFVSEDRDKQTGDLLIIRLFGSVDK